MELLLKHTLGAQNSGMAHHPTLYGPSTGVPSPVWPTLKYCVLLRGGHARCSNAHKSTHRGNIHLILEFNWWSIQLFEIIKNKNQHRENPATLNVELLLKHTLGAQNSGMAHHPTLYGPHTGVPSPVWPTLKYCALCMVATLRCSNARKSTQEPTCMGPRNTASTLDKALACKYKFLWVHVRREQEPYHYFEHPGHVAGSFFIF